MKSAEIRQKFLDYFSQHGHQTVPSSSLVPGNDPTLLFTNAGMVQFKDVFLGLEKRPYNRAASSQRCVRAGGKHNDLENVGYTARHHTFFEMLGNFSFGDYFKEEAIQFAWQFLTQELGLPEEKLWVTVYQDDDQAADIWLNKIGVSAERFSRLGKEDNFWSMGDVGPCGPCSEIFYDHGPGVPGGPPGSPEEDGDRYIEIWNLVFMQFESAADGSMTNLPKPSVDTGMGLERIAAVMQNVHNNYEIDLFANLIKEIADIVSCDQLTNASLRVIADHIRACSFLIVDGVLPSNEGRGYVLRRIIRRAIRHGYKLGVKEAFFYRLVKPLEREMGAAYPELTKNLKHLEKILRTEEQRFAETLDQGMAILEKVIADVDNGEIPGETAFKLYDTYGFPLDLTADIARERSMVVDQAGFDKAMQVQRNQAKAASRFGAEHRSSINIEDVSDFKGYDTVESSSVVSALVQGEEATQSLLTGDDGIVFLKATPFYAESGGQVGDIGELLVGAARFCVSDTQKFGNGIGHIGRVVSGQINQGDTAIAKVDGAKRRATVRNHTATHLMHAALRQVLGDHVVQKGSLVAPDRLRFDFSHYEAVSAEELEQIEAIVNQQIRSNHPAQTRLMDFDQAVEAGAMALFGEKYSDQVRVLSFGEFSIELCGGTHVSRTGDIGVFKITSETGIASGVRRIEALTGEMAMNYILQSEGELLRLASLVKSTRGNVAGKVETLLERNRALEKELAKAKKALAMGGGSNDLTSQVEKVGNISVLAARLDGLDAGSLRDTVDQLRDRLGSSVIVLGAVEDHKVRLVAGVSKDCITTVKAGELIAEIAQMVGGRGGGRPDMAQAGGSDPSQLDAALKSVVDKVKSRI